MIDEHAVTDLKLYIDNDAQLARQQFDPIRKNLATKKIKSEYKHALAVKLFGYLVENGAKKYAKDFGGVWHQLFPVPMRKAVAEALTKDFEGAFELGEYDYLLPKKYQAEMTSGTKKFPSKGVSMHATKKAKWKTPESIKVVWSIPNSAYFALWPGRGAVKDQSVLKVASANEMHDWLRSTYGDAYGLVGRTSSHATKSRHATISARDIREFRGFLHNASDRQVQGIYDKEKRAGRDEYAELAVAEADRRGIVLDNGYDHARKKSPAQLDREIAHALRRGGR